MAISRREKISLRIRHEEIPFDRIMLKMGCIEDNSLPIVSVLIAVRNEKEYITRCIESLINQDYPVSRCEIITIDGMSTDGTKDIVVGYPGVRLFDNPNKIKSSGLNIGIKESRGSIVIIVDGHARVERDFITKSVEYLQKTDAACVGGAIRTIGEGYMGKTIACVLSCLFGVGNAKFRYSSSYEGYIDTVPFGAYWKKVFNEVGFFDESRQRTEDLDLHARIRKKGGKFFMTPEIKSYYYCRSTLKGLMKQAFSNGYEVVTALHAISARHLAPLIFVLSLLASLIFSFFADVGKILFGIITGSYLIASLFFSFGIGIKKGLKYVPALPITFFTLHFGYGLGSLWGLLIFWKSLDSRRKKRRN